MQMDCQDGASSRSDQIQRLDCRQQNSGVGNIVLAVHDSGGAEAGLGWAGLGNLEFHNTLSI